MHYGLIAIGSRGDVQPFVALSLGLRARGHQVTLMAHENFAAFVRPYAIDFLPLTGSTEDMLAEPEGLRHLQSGNSFRLLRYIRERSAHLQDQVNRDLCAGCGRADVLVTSALGVPWVSCIAEKTGKRWAHLQLSFPTTTTGEFPFAGLDYLNFPAYNRFSYRLFRSFAWRQCQPDVNHFRRSLGLTPLKQSIFDRAEADEILTCYAVSPALLHRPSDWAAHNIVTGHLTMPPMPSQSSNSIPDELLEWLKAAEKPMYIGFGSMPIPDPARFIQVLDALLSHTRHRYLFCAGWSAVPSLPTDRRLFVASSIDHDWLFPQCTAAIIHGGVGTLTATLRAGCPTVIVSIFGDQHWWGKWTQKKALGRHVPFKRLSAERLVAAIQSVVSPPITQNLAVMARQMKGEDGLQTTIDSLEDYFAKANR